jgi:glycosyltransferase involved in cell wall biosynthesis
VRPDALKALTLQATIGLNLLENRGLSYYYSLANKSFDYIQAGLPSLHMNFPEYLAINQEQEVFLLLDELTPRAIAEAVNRLIADPELYQRLHENCRQARKQYCWEEEKVRLLGIYEGLEI